MGLVSKDPNRLQIRHLSIRVPWHDNRWDGNICKNPQSNAACLVLQRIRDLKKNEQETKVAGKSIKELPFNEWPACIAERGSFMAPFEFFRRLNQPYSATSDLHKHMLPTDFRHPPYSAAAIPFRWMNRKFAWDLAEKHELDVGPEREPTEPEWLKNSTWVQNHENQRAILENFFNAIEPEKSLCFFYAKRTPLAEDERRVIVGVGRVQQVGPLVEYKYEKKGGIRAFIWDRAVQHSIRPDFCNGFLMPYHEIFALAEKDLSIDPTKFIAYAPGNDRYDEFTYATEHVTHDGAIEALLACMQALEKSRSLVAGPWDRVLKWIDTCLSELWKLRGPYPGLGVALTAFGFKHGNFLAYELASKLGENEDPWPIVNNVFHNPSILPRNLAQQITPTFQAKWNEININKPNRLALLKLLARMELSIEQAVRFYIEEEREAAGIESKDYDLLADPYLIYELDRISSDPISVLTVDRALFPNTVVRDKHPLSLPSKLEDSVDPRRVRALTINMLECAADEGHTLLPRSDVVRAIRDLPIKPDCSIDGDLLDVIATKLSPLIQVCNLKNGSPAYQLDRYASIGALIRSTVKKRMSGKRHTINVDWHQELNKKFGKIDLTEKEEERARYEKAAALKELAESRFSVLIGPAGTGKTSLLSVLCNQQPIKNSGILLLAPTGKARVKLQQSTGILAKTLAQFLLRLDRYDEETGIYRLSTRDKIEAGKTVIVDEASMLTEEQLGALLDALKGVDRLILVGDPRQLPPIGAGRPFIDIVAHLAHKDIEVLFPKISEGYAELTVRRRQAGEVREDLQFAEWFSGRSLGPGEDEILSRALNHEKIGNHIRFLEWKDTEDIHKKLLDVLTEELKLNGINDIAGFELNLGGKKFGNYVYFHPGASEKAEMWQVLTPTRGMAYGVVDLNRLIQTTFRTKTIENAKQRFRKIP